jgi:hypothetical protein
LLFSLPVNSFLKLTGVKRRSAKLLLVLAGLLFGLLIAEITLRLIGYSFPNFYTTDQYRGVALRAGVEGLYRKEGNQYVWINSEGFHDREHAKAKPPNTLRVAVVGDSYVEALQVPLAQTFWTVMEQKLRGCQAFAGRTVEVLAFGVSGYGTAQELITLRQCVWDYQPDIVVLVMTTNNDVTDNSRVFKKSDIPYFVYQDDKLVLDDSFQRSRTFRLRSSTVNRFLNRVRDHLRVIQAIDEAQIAIKTYMTSKRAQPNSLKNERAQNESPEPQAQKETSRLEEVGIDNQVYREPESREWVDAWRVTEDLIVLMRDEVKSKGAKFLVVTASNAIQVHPSPQARQAFMRLLGVNDLFYPDLRIRALSEREGIPVLNLAPALQAYAEQHQLFLHGTGRQIGNGHWNPLGHRVAGEMIAEKLCEGMAQ